MVSQNSVYNTIPDSEFSANEDTAGTGVVYSVNHSDNTNTASHAEHLVQVGGTSGGDPFYRASVTGGQDYSFGPDNTDSDTLKITDNADPSTGNILWDMTSAGLLTLPKQPAFSASLQTADTNVTGNGAVYAFGTNVALTELFDIGGNLSPGGAAAAIFTAPVTGKYFFNCWMTIEGLTSGMVGFILRITTSNNVYQGENTNPFAQRNTGSGHYGTIIDAFADMDAADTMFVNVIASGGAGNTADLAPYISGTPDISLCGISGYLVV